MTLADRLRQALAGRESQELLAGDLDDSTAAAPDRAAVLIAVTDRAEPGVILTVRCDNLRAHAGQVAFPGGRTDPGETAVDAAVREAWEELEIDPAAVEPVAELDPYCTITGFAVTPVLAAVPADLPIRPHDREVADWFEAPLAHLLDPAQHRLESMLFAGRPRSYYQIEWNGRRIWGATAAMLVNLSRRLRWS